ncbi:hypothetical protein EYC80_007972 [Monilinia laxa]|uniref:Uncharacterized protein n=1 Tax=Monilinia laxa TaxID=61186 RepID=A0A5N6JVF7_MONLA|nr:hypothetical protein EYC80_007972 [Monilinia laxa]
MILRLSEWLEESIPTTPASVSSKPSESSLLVVEQNTKNPQLNTTHLDSKSRCLLLSIQRDPIKNRGLGVKLARLKKSSVMKQNQNVPFVT